MVCFHGVTVQGPAICRHFLSKPGRVKGNSPTPTLGFNPSKQENEVFIGIHGEGGWVGASPWLPTFLKGANLKARGYPWEQVR